jgi:hypothetical protein
MEYGTTLYLKAGLNDQRLMMTLFCAPLSLWHVFFVTMLGNNLLNQFPEQRSFLDWGA